MVMIKIVGSLLLSVLIFFCVTSDVQAEPLEKITIAGPMAVVTYPMLVMVENGKFDQIAKKVKVRIWQNPDQLRAMILGNEADFLAVPTNVASMFYNKGVDLRLLNVSVWGILHMVSRDDTLTTLADFKGKEIAMPFKGDMPDIVFSEIARRQGLDPKHDFTIRYVSNPMDAVQLLILRRVDHALLAEPAVSMVLYKTKHHKLIKIVAPDLYRSVDLQKEWGEVFKTDNDIPQAGIAALKTVNGNEEVISIFQKEYQAAIEWCLANPEETGKIVEKYIKGLKAAPVATALGATNLKFKTAKESKEKLVHFFSVLSDSEPKKIGGKLPDDSFYR
jgi:NitT/TauT family transport system substrate-binding protein